MTKRPRDRVLIRVLSYNLLEGGPKGRRKFAKQMEMVRKLNPTIVCFQEAKRWLDAGETRLCEAERLLGMRLYVARAPRFDCNVVTGVRPGSGLTVVRHRNREREPAWHAQGRLLFDNGLTVVNDHWCPDDPARRLAQAHDLKGVAAGPAIVAADFNDDPLGEPPPPDARGHKATSHTYPDSDEIDWRAAVVLQRAGFIDVAAHLAKQRNDPTLLATTAGHRKGSTPRRTDRIQVTDLEIIDYRLITQKFSDHHAVMADLLY